MAESAFEKTAAERGGDELNAIALIPARGGSKGLPRKNILPLCGKPLIAWSIEQARASQVDAVYVTTDDAEIASVSREWGAEVIDRPAELATDTASTEAALTHALGKIFLPLTYEQRANYCCKVCENVPDEDGCIEHGKGCYTQSEDGGGSSYVDLPTAPVELVVLLQPTSPIRQPGDIDGAIKTLIDSHADSLFSARRVEGFIWRDGLSRWFTEDYSPRNRPRRQDLELKTEENGSIYVFRPWVLREYGSRLGGKVACYLQHPLDSFQVDGPEDLELMELLMPVRLAGFSERPWLEPSWKL